MDQETKDKWAIWAPILAVVVSIFLSAVISNFNRTREAVTEVQATDMVESKGEEVLIRSKAYTDIKIMATDDKYEKRFEHIEKMVDSNTETIHLLLEKISERLDRIDKRISELKE